MNNQDKKSTNTKNEPSPIAVFIGIVVIAFIIIFGFNQCFGENNAEQNESLRYIRDEIYALFQTNVSEKIDGSDYYTDVQYSVDWFQSEFNKMIDSPVEISFEEVSDSLYESTWVCGVIVNDTVYPLFYMTVTFSSSFKVTNVVTGKYKIDGE